MLEVRTIDYAQRTGVLLKSDDFPSASASHLTTTGEGVVRLNIHEVGSEDRVYRGGGRGRNRRHDRMRSGDR